GLVCEVGLDLQETAPAHRQAPDAGGGVAGVGACRELERVGAAHRAVRTDIEEVAGGPLRWPEITEVAIQGRVLTLPVVVAAELDPAVQAGVEVIVREDA